MSSEANAKERKNDAKMQCKKCFVKFNIKHPLLLLLYIYIYIYIDDVVNLTSEKHDSYAQISHLHKRRKQEDLVEGTDVVPAKYPPKVKLEIFSQL